MPGVRRPGLRGSASCETCAGKGRLTRSATLRGGDWLQVEECSDCNGRGFSEQDACPECRGEGSLSQEQVVKVRIPAGVEDGNRLRMVGDPDGEQLLVQVWLLPQDSYLVLALAAVLLLCSVALLVYFLNAG